MAFRGLQAESIEQGQAHAAVANDLHTLVADPFEHWAQGHKVRTLHGYRSTKAHPTAGQAKASEERGS